jgi:hypothetical protein
MEAESSDTCGACCASLAKLYNPIIQGWWNYYGAFYPTAMLDVYRTLIVRWNYGPGANIKSYRDGNDPVRGG